MVDMYRKKRYKLSHGILCHTCALPNYILTAVRRRATISSHYPFDTRNTRASRKAAQGNSHRSDANGYTYILVAEDDPVNCIYIKNLLYKHGYRVDLAKNGEEVIEKWREEPAYDLILMDVQMPGISGIEATAEIRAREEEEGRDPIPIIAVTAYTKGNEKDDMFMAGVTNYITKPINVHQLLELLGRTLGQEQSPVSSAGDTGAGAATATGAAAGSPGSAEASSGSSAEEHEYMEKLLEEFGDARDTLSEMLDMSLKELPQRMEAIEAGLTAGNTNSAAENCHALANVASILKAERLRDEAISLERLLRSDHRDSAESQIAVVSRLTDSLMRSFRKILKKES